VDDILDYESADDALGKPGGADLQLGLTTGPALYAWEEYPELGPLIHRKFNQQGDVELVSELANQDYRKLTICRHENLYASLPVYNVLETLLWHTQTKPVKY